MADPSPLEEPAERRTRVRGVVIGVAAALVIVAVPIVFLALDDDAPSARRTVRTDALATVRAAVGQTFAAGSYEMDTVSTATWAAMGGRSTEFTSHSIVNLEPYAMVADSSSATYGHVTLHVNSTHVWQLGAATVGYGPGTPGVLLSDYSRQVVGSIGPGPGALAMISIASRGGYLNLEDEAVSAAEPAGTGTVDGAAVTYYDVTIDIRKLADAANLSDVQRQTIAAALPLLEQGGYTGTSERLGVDDSGNIRSVDATTSFDDGSSMVRRSVLSKFGCAPTVSMPNEAPPPAMTAPSCAPAATTTTTTSEPTTTVPVATSTTSVPTSATAATTTTTTTPTTSTSTTAPESTTSTSTSSTSTSSTSTTTTAPSGDEP